MVPEVDAAVDRSLTEAAYASERVYSLLRLVFCALIGVRTVTLWLFLPVPHDNPGERALVTLLAIAIAIAFSAAILSGAWRSHTRIVVHVSVAIDAAVAFGALLPNSLWPPPNYLGLPFMMDTSSLFLVTMATGLRHAPSAVVLGGALNVLVYFALAAVDHVVSGDRTEVFSVNYTMYAILIISAAAIAFVIARRTRMLVANGARVAVQAAQASRGLHSVLRDHHDLRTAISSVQLNADLVATGETNAFGHLQEDIVALRAQLELIKARALAEVAQVEGIVAAPLAAAVDNVFVAMRSRYPAIELAGSGALETAVLVAGGDVTLRRILSNLVVNACEGDGRKAATRVEVRARVDGERVAVEVADDGPGLPASVLTANPGTAASTKVDGTGIGMGLVDSLVRASGGSVVWRNRDGTGAIATIELRTNK